MSIRAIDWGIQGGTPCAKPIMFMRIHGTVAQTGLTSTALLKRDSKGWGMGDGGWEAGGGGGGHIPVSTHPTYSA